MFFIPVTLFSDCPSVSGGQLLTWGLFSAGRPVARRLTPDLGLFAL